MLIGRALALPVFSIAIGLVSGVFSAGVAAAQTPTTAVEDDLEPRGPAPSQEEIDDRRAESRKRRKSVVIPNRPSGEADVGDREQTDEEREAREQKEADNERERERDEEEAEGPGGGTNWRAVGIGLTVSGLVVGLGGGALGVAGGVTGDQPTQIAAACVGLTGSALAVAGLIVALTAPPSGPPPVARMLPSVTLGFGPTSASLFVSF